MILKKIKIESEVFKALYKKSIKLEKLSNGQERNQVEAYTMDPIDFSFKKGKKQKATISLSTNDSPNTEYAYSIYLIQLTNNIVSFNGTTELHGKVKVNLSLIHIFKLMPSFNKYPTPKEAV